MTNLELWPWGVAIIVFLSMLIGWFAREIYRRFELNKKDEIIQAQEKEYIKLADQHVEKNRALKKIIADLEERLEFREIKNSVLGDPAQPFEFTKEDINEIFKDAADQPTSEDIADLIDEKPDPITDALGDKIVDEVAEPTSEKVLELTSDEVAESTSEKVLEPTTNEVAKPTSEEIAELIVEEFSDHRTEADKNDLSDEQLESPSEEDSALVKKLKDEIDHLKIDKQKLSTVPQALYIEKNAVLKKEVKTLKKDLNQTAGKIDGLKKKLKKYKKKLKRREQKNVKLVEIHEHIDFKQLKKLLKNIPTKKTRVVRKAKRKKDKPKEES